MRNEICQQDSKEKTSNTPRFSDCFKNENELIESQFKRWNRRFLKAIHTSFRRIRIKDKSETKPTLIDILMNKKRNIIKKKVLSLEDKNEVESTALHPLHPEYSTPYPQWLRQILGIMHPD